MATADVMRTPVQLPPFHYHPSTPYQPNGAAGVSPVDPLLSPNGAIVELAPVRDTTAVVSAVQQSIQLFPPQTPVAGRSKPPVTPVTAIHTNRAPVQLHFEATPVVFHEAGRAAAVRALHRLADVTKDLFGTSSPATTEGKLAELTQKPAPRIQTSNYKICEELYDTGELKVPGRTFSRLLPCKKPYANDEDIIAFYKQSQSRD